MAFSGALTLTDLSDYLTPSQQCIKPVEELPGETNDLGTAATQIQVDAEGAYYEVLDGKEGPKEKKKLKAAQITLNDCLACSGCITTAESVLITLQSSAEVISVLEDNPPPHDPGYRLPVLSIAPQCLASLAASISPLNGPPVPLRSILRRIQAFCKRLGFVYVFDTTFARHLSLLELEREFCERRDLGKDGKLPMLSSACPGWICYAEKTHGEMLPFVSRTKSSQQIMGTFVKEWLGQKCGKRPNEVYHVSVMACYDKKLEASRQDFYDARHSTRDVDSVVTTGELEEMMKHDGWDLTSPVPGEDEEIPASLDHPIYLPELLNHQGTSSGSYVHRLLAFLSSKISNPVVTTRTIRSSDYEEYILTNGDTGEVLFKGAKCYGFRNLQNVVRKIGREVGVQVGRSAAAGRMAGGAGMRARRKPGTGSGMDDARGYDYVEVMACPGGTVNGGGQIRPPQIHRSESAALTGTSVGAQQSSQTNGEEADVPLRWGDRDWIKRVEANYWEGLPTQSSSAKDQLTDADMLAQRVLADLCQPKRPCETWSAAMGDGAEERRRRFFQTEYRAVISEVIGLAVKW